MISSVQYLAGEAVDVKICPRTSLGVLSQAAAATDTHTFTGRATRPYPPGNFKFNGSAYPSTISGTLTLTWAHRNRLTQTAYLVAQSEGNIGPEAGTTYTLKLYGDGGVLKKTETGLTGTSYTWSDEAAGGTSFSLVGSSTVTYATTTSQSATIPAAVAADDLLIAVIMHRADLTAPAGWTLVKNQTATGGTTRVDVSVYKRTAVAGDAGASTTWTQATSQRMAVQIQAYRHPNGATVATSTGTSTSNTTAVTTVPYATITTTQENQLVIHAAAQIIVNGGTNVTTATASPGTLTTPSSVVDNRMYSAYVTAATIGSQTGHFSVNVPDSSGNAQVAVSVSLTTVTPTDPVNTTVRAVLTSVVGGRESHQAQDWTVTRV